MIERKRNQKRNKGDSIMQVRRAKARRREQLSSNHHTIKVANWQRRGTHWHLNNTTRETGKKKKT